MDTTELEKKHKELSAKTLTAVQRRNNDALARELNKTHQALVVEPEREKSRVPEAVFKERFLPYFSGEINIADNDSILPLWIGIAGSPSAEVSIVDQTGNIIFDVPAIMDLTVIDSAKHKLGESLAEIYSQYDLHSSQLPVIGEKFLADAIAKKTPTMFKPSEKYLQNTERWNSIFDRYGIVHNTEKNDSKQIIKTLGDIDIEYE